MTNKETNHTDTTLFGGFPKMARLSRECIITEKIDGTNASILIHPLKDSDPTPEKALSITSGFAILAGSRTRWITPEDDNFGFAAWVRDHLDELLTLGPGQHFGEWWGQGIQRKYGMTEKRFSLFNVSRWCLHGETPGVIPSHDPRIIKTQDTLPPCCHLVPLLGRGEFSTPLVEHALVRLRECGSFAAPGFMKPEGVVVFHVAGNVGFKKTLEGDEVPKGQGLPNVMAS
jgi:hypothetical protein